MGENPTLTRSSQLSRTESDVQRGNELDEAQRMDVSGRNVSECIEPRNTPCRRGRRFSLCRKTISLLRFGKQIETLPGSEAMA